MPPKQGRKNKIKKKRTSCERFDPQALLNKLREEGSLWRGKRHSGIPIPYQGAPHTPTINPPPTIFKILHIYIYIYICMFDHQANRPIVGPLFQTPTWTGDTFSTYIYPFPTPPASLVLDISLTKTSSRDQTTLGLSIICDCLALWRCSRRKDSHATYHCGK